MLSRRQVWPLIGPDLLVLVLTAVSFAIASRNRSDASRWSDVVFLSLVAINGIAMGFGTLPPVAIGGKGSRAARLPPGLPLLVALAVTPGLRLAATFGG